jgi:hypothetical protein
MTIFEEVEKIIAQLPAEQAFSLKFWLKEFQAARRYKKIKSYTMALKVLADFEKSNGNALWN